MELREQHVCIIDGRDLIGKRMDDTVEVGLL